MIRRKRREPDPPIEAVEGGYLIRLTVDERTMVKRLLGELAELIEDPDPDEQTQRLIERLFPAAYNDDPDAEAEYQRLMREELVASRQAAFDIVEAIMDNDTDEVITEGDLVAWMQSLNSIRLVLGTMLQVSDDPDEPEIMPGFENSREYHLYGYLSWLLEWTVNALSGTVSPPVDDPDNADNGEREVGD